MFSIVIPLYNKSKSIERTLSSVLNQTFQKFEIVIINDGSTDNGVEVIQDFTQDSRIIIIDQDNKGVSAARNVGVKNSHYDYIAFLDGDDEWHEDYLKKMKESIDLFPLAGMYCCAGLIKSVLTDNSSLRLASKYKDQIKVINFFENPHVFLHTSATVVAKSEFIKTTGFPVGMKKNQDFAFFFSLALITQVVYCGFTLSYYFGDVEGQTTSVVDKYKSVDHVINRFNHTYQNWLETDCQNKLFEVFMKYELRHIFKILLKSYDYDIISLYLEKLDDNLISEFLNFEISLYKNRKFNNIALLYIILTKLRWRLRRYPRVLN